VGAYPQGIIREGKKERKRKEKTEGKGMGEEGVGWRLEKSRQEEWINEHEKFLATPLVKPLPETWPFQSDKLRYGTYFFRIRNQDFQFEKIFF
jgi:hypothetical protein